MYIIEPKVEVEQFNGIDIMKKLERAGKTCYRSESNITAESYKNFIKNLIARGHESVLEHEKVTVRLTCDTGVVKELTRHRIANFSIESTRYCNYSKDKFEKGLRFIKPIFSEENEKMALWLNTMSVIEETYLEMAELGAKPDELRMILPHSIAAEVVMTANIREWRHILQLRAQKAAHPAVRQLMIPLLLYFKKEMSELFEDIDYDTDFNPSLYAELKQIED